MQFIKELYNENANDFYERAECFDDQAIIEHNIDGSLALLYKSRATGQWFRIKEENILDFIRTTVFGTGEYK